ncbi:MAG: site-specific DNA-methyltransferase [Chloroflexi bacterium]|nr:site-specific DNA-methyltransferase [Chloroflexota bacterium]
MSVTDRIIVGDSLEILPTLPAHSVDLVFADPPYNLQLRQDLWRPNMTLVDAVNDEWDQFDSFRAYDEFTRAWLRAVRTVMKPTATLWVSGTYHNIFRVGQALQDLGFWLLNTVTWFKPNAMPNFRGKRFKNDVEFVIWAKHSPDSRYTFNHQTMKQFNNGKQLGCTWAINVCGGAERLRDVEGRKLHPTQKPEALLERIILASSKPGYLVLDPFVGTGTTAAVARRLHRHWIGIDQEPAYVEAARARVAAVEPLPPDDPLLKLPVRRKRVRVPFKTLLEWGYLRPGQKLYLDRSDQIAVILENGQLRANGVTGSIHQVGAKLTDTPTCNGWQRWYFVDESTGQYEVLDVLRQKLRQTLKEQE